MGREIKSLLERSDEPHVFRLHKDRVFYLSERVMRAAATVSRDAIISMGVCFGKFTKGKNFRLKITCLDYLAQHARVREGGGVGELCASAGKPAMLHSRQQPRLTAHTAPPPPPPSLSTRCG